MTSGLPDFYRGVDIKLQSLSEVTNRPKYGGGIQSAGSDSVVGGFRNILALITGKGMIYGGSVWLDYTSTQANSIVALAIDGAYLAGLSFVRLKDYNIVDPRSSVITINKFDSTNYIYSAGISYGLTFETSLQLLYNEEHDVTPTVHFNLMYTLI